MPRLGLFLIAILMVTSCNDGTKEEIVSTYPDGSPMKIEYVKYIGDRRVVEKETRFYSNGEKEEEGAYFDDKRHGHWIYWYDNGQVWSEGDFDKGVRTGKGIVNYKNGKTNFIGYYKQGKADSLWVFFDGEGKKIKEVLYRNGRTVPREGPVK